MSYSPAVTGSKEEASLSRLRANGLFLIFNSVRDYTRKPYDAGVSAWFTFCLMVCCVPFLSKFPSKVMNESCVYGLKEDLVIAFISHFYLDKHFRPTTVGTYLTSLKICLKLLGWISLSFRLRVCRLLVWE